MEARFGSSDAAYESRLQVDGEDKVVGDLLQGIGSAVGVFIGVVSGTAVTILAHRFQERRFEKRQVRNLSFELRLNTKKIDGWLEELARYRNAVNGDNLHNWFGYFDLGKTVSATASAMLASGLLYNTLVHQHVEALQVVFWELSPAGENYINEQFKARRDAFNQLRRAKNSLLWLNSAKPEAVRLADYWEDRLRGHRATLEDITRAIHES